MHSINVPTMWSVILVLVILEMFSHFDEISVSYSREACYVCYITNGFEILMKLSQRTVAVIFNFSASCVFVGHACWYTGLITESLTR